MPSLYQHIDSLSVSPVIIPSLMNGGKTAKEALESYKKEWTVWVTYCFSEFVLGHNASGEEQLLIVLSKTELN